ncbi:MAG: tRNA epoxyqueuosine(34) reductase QueG [Anaerolineae bacterium]
MSLTGNIQERAGELGFDLVGIAHAEPSAYGGRYARWLENGYAGEMEYLRRDVSRRLDPGELLPGVRSIVSVGLNYFSPDPVETHKMASPVGLISRYARGEDYHRVLNFKLSQLLAFIKREADQEVRSKVYVDTGPLLEREIANRAGLGWFGKNTNLINPEQGSWFFLGEILLDLELVHDTLWPADHCGTCTRCLEVCPTKALVVPYTLNASRCISYLTIELKGSIPQELRPFIGNWVFGCDLCQEVCPWNQRFARPTAEMALRPREGLAAPELLSLLGIGEEEFRVKFRKSPIKRAKRRGLLRNVAVALGNSRDEAAIPALRRALSDPEPLVRGHAAWALGRIGGKRARRALEEAFGREADAEVRGEIWNALKGL